MKYYLTLAWEIFRSKIYYRIYFNCHI